MNGIRLVGGMENSFSHREGKGVDVSQRPTKKKKRRCNANPWCDQHTFCLW
jgi:hypothetical protein